MCAGVDVCGCQLIERSIEVVGDMELSSGMQFEAICQQNLLLLSVSNRSLASAHTWRSLTHWLTHWLTH